MTGGLETTMPGAGNSEEVGGMVGRQFGAQLTLNAKCNSRDSVAPLSIQCFLCRQEKKSSCVL